MFRRVFPDPQQPRTVVVVPSLSMDVEVLSRITGVQHYEERMLCMLMLLRFPRTRVIYVTSVPIDPWIIDYYLHLLPGIPSSHARKRLMLFACHDASPATVTQKILERPRLLNRIREAIPDLHAAHMTCFNATSVERSLCVELGVPLYACDPALAHLGTKSGSREVFRAAGVSLPDGMERLRAEADVAEALAELKRRQPGLRRSVVKLDEGVSGEGNATFSYAGCPSGEGLKSWVRSELPIRLRFEARDETWEHCRTKFEQMGGVVEVFVDGDDKRSPSAQCRIDPLGRIEMISTHDQVLGGAIGPGLPGLHVPGRGRLPARHPGGRSEGRVGAQIPGGARAVWCRLRVDPARRHLEARGGRNQSAKGWHHPYLHDAPVPHGWDLRHINPPVPAPGWTAALLS
ncbi:MAG TPA: hypothetical protein QGF05_05220, partial [Dehalococcoidia bacterium]|nr:hypothetical protein [Dehalococcoidia bacterium]